MGRSINAATTTAVTDLNDVDLRVLVVRADPLSDQNLSVVAQVTRPDDQVHQVDVLLPPGGTRHHGPAPQLRQQAVDGLQPLQVYQRWKAEARQAVQLQ